MLINCFQLHKTGYGVCNAFGIINMGLIDIPDHHVLQFIHLNVECKLLEQDRMAKHGGCEINQIPMDIQLQSMLLF